MIGLVCRTLAYRTGTVRKSDKVLKQIEVKYMIYGFAFDFCTVQKNPNLKTFFSIQETRLKCDISLSSSSLYFLIQKQQKLDSAGGSGFLEV